MNIGHPGRDLLAGTRERGEAVRAFRIAGWLLIGVDPPARVVATGPARLRLGRLTVWDDDGIGCPGFPTAAPVGCLCCFVAGVVACAVATGTDYTILTIARLRGGTGLGGDRRTLAHHAVAQLGPAIGVAGLLLAGLPCRSGGGRRL